MGAAFPQGPAICLLSIDDPHETARFLFVSFYITLLGLGLVTFVLFCSSVVPHSDGGTQKGAARSILGLYPSEPGHWDGRFEWRYWQVVNRRDAWQVAISKHFNCALYDFSTSPYGNLLFSVSFWFFIICYITGWSAFSRMSSEVLVLLGHW